MVSESLQIVIAGATSLRGKDLKEGLEESGFPATKINLLDDDLAVGTITEVGGEPTVVQSVDEASFEGQRFVFFAGSRDFALQHGTAAQHAGATVIDLTGGLAASPGARPWIPQLDRLAGQAPPGTNRSNVYLAPGTAAIVACALSAALQEFSPIRMTIVFLQPVSERGQFGIEELEQQTAKLLSLQPMPQEVFDAQVAFNLLDRWGAQSAERLSTARAELDREVRAWLASRALVPAMKLVQAPVFFGVGFSAYAEFAKPLDSALAVARLRDAGFTILEGEDPKPSNVSIAGSAQPAIRMPEPDPGVEGGYWFWGVADNLRVATANAIHVAERLVAS